jgi:hypothetical protein
MFLKRTQYNKKKEVNNKMVDEGEYNHWHDEGDDDGYTEVDNEGYTEVDNEIEYSREILDECDIDDDEDYEINCDEED